MFTSFKYIDADANEVNFLMAVGTSGGYIGLTDFDPELMAEGEDRSRMEANQSWPTFTYYNRLLIMVQADMICQTPADFVTLKIATMGIIMVDPVANQTVRTQGQLRMRLAGQTEDWTIPVSVATPPKFQQPATSPSAASFSVTFKAFRPYWYRLTSADYKWLT